MPGRSTVQAYLYIVFALMMLVVSWESNLAGAALIHPAIPEESIRIRILAHSDRVEDQWIKKEIREAIVAYVNGWNREFAGIEEARNEVKGHLREMGDIIGALLEKYGFPYGYQVELGMVDFPAKVFGQEIYPAGEYEALRITLGDGQGENWWCVLFPPLCFGGAVKAKTAEPAGEAVAATAVIAAGIVHMNGVSNKSMNTEGTGIYRAPLHNGEDVEVRFFLWDMLKKARSVIKGLK